MHDERETACTLALLRCGSSPSADPTYEGVAADYAQIKRLFVSRTLRPTNAPAECFLPVVSCDCHPRNRHDNPCHPDLHPQTSQAALRGFEVFIWLPQNRCCWWCSVEESPNVTASESS